MTKRNASKPDGRYAWNKGKTASTDERIRAYSAKMQGRTFSPEHRARIAQARSTSRVFYDACQECGRKKGHSQRMRCNHCAARWRAATYPNAMSGRKLSEQHKLRLLQSNKKQVNPTKPELWISNVLDFMFGAANPFEYTGCGDGRFWVTVNGRTRRPDFVSTNLKQVIEVFGRYWHPPEDEAATIEHYRAAGWQCLVIWEDDRGSVRDQILEFAFPYEYHEELRACA